MKIRKAKGGKIFLKIAEIIKKIHLSHQFKFIFVTVISLIVITPIAFYGYNFYNADLYKKMAEESFRNANYQGAADFYQTSLVYHQDSTVKSKLDESQKLAISTQYYLRGLKALQNAKTKEDYQKAASIFSKVVSENIYYKKAQEKIAFCNQKIKEIENNEQNESASENLDKNQLTEEYNVSDQEPAPANSPPGCNGEEWNNFCLVGDDEFKNKMKEILNIIAAIAPSHFENVKIHARVIQQISAGGVSSCSDSISIGLKMWNNIYEGDTYRRELQTESNWDLAQTVVHEADHGREGMCIGAGKNHTEMFNNWEAEFQSLVSLYLRSIKLNNYRYKFRQGETYTFTGYITDPRAVNNYVVLVNSGNGQRIEKWLPLGPGRTFSWTVTFNLGTGLHQLNMSLADAEDVANGFVGYFDNNNIAQLWVWVD